MIATRIIVEGAGRAAQWYVAVLGAEERQRITLPDGRLIDVELWFGPSKVVLADEFPEHGARSPKATGCSSAVFYLDVDDVDVVWERALAQGATVLRPLADWFTGERDGQIVDPLRAPVGSDPAPAGRAPRRDRAGRGRRLHDRRVT